MDFLIFLSTYIIPFVLFLVVGYGLLKKQNVYETFIAGAVDGFHTVIGIMPTLVGLMVAVGILRASGFLDMLAGLLGYPLRYIGFPAELVPVTIVRMFSSSAATGLVLDIFKKYGTDSFFGILASISMGCTETIFYTMSVYFMTVKVKKTRYTLAGALLATLTGIVASLILARGFSTHPPRFSEVIHSFTQIL